MISSQTAAARKDEAAQNQTTDEQSQKDDWQDHIAKIIEYSKQLKEDYHTQGKITHQLAKAEWRLSLRSMALITIFLGCFASGLILLWAGLLGALGYGMYDLFGSVWLSIATAALAQVICLVWLWKNTVYLSNKIGFSKTIKSLKQLFNL
ncbi:hypothetical protein PC2016_0573 [Pseudoalteromonas carrageenovora]|uniref:Orphan protein n=1 Tax=Pseudoalteromonas carrageenovora IAM 12662 TaxID=1314868 RepID=A0A2K4X6C2_PSEVC|nr:hypothetical protein [Pseudoalteromonas carrageenovora]MBE0382084.1 hypothetical protein [Pseudoalteromonas carrageenovora IAM 12662]QBJ70816.1 hypothetical protein PC2016_0573 [Pseudoalteromonas carrageenovora]GEB69901.1 hypothetical protein PCA01_06110 [Pseudoalteromonas carrageenovora]SOU39882.1 conserved protein of unknown function [Pseudoalteromonas carrageenovora IAM 12662]